MRTIALAAVLGGLLLQPVLAQTTQVSPTAPATSIPTRPHDQSPAFGVVDINRASAKELDKLPGIGPARADAIIKHRPYRGKDDLLARHIIPAGVYNGIKDRIIAKQG
jgi:DNA uptake protein ComE-like DNA-binding protein